MAFSKLLFDIDNNLGQDDFECLKFLCLDIITNKKKLEKMESCLDLFDELQKSGDLNEDNYIILAELLYLIGQHSLLKKLGTDRKAMEDYLKEERQVSMYRRMLHDLSENITNQDQRHIIFLLEIPSKFKENKSFFEILVYLDKTEKISQDNVDILEKVIREVSKELLKKINTYKQYRESQQMMKPPSPKENIDPYSSDPPLSVQAVSSTDMACQNDEMESIREHIEQVQELPSFKDVETENDMSRLNLEDQPTSEVYPMNQKHRGYCVIINNKNFLKSDERKGTEKDVESLTHVFTWLEFDVVVYNEQNSQQICDIMMDFQIRDHTDRDCFVCCILTHGESQGIFGIDNRIVNIKDIVSSFSSTNCKTLAGKPKLFFIQACQGATAQGAHLIEEDAISSSKSIPNEADVLIGMSTVDGYSSFRHTATGSWYIQALCSNLFEMVPKREDILSILTKVNKDVSEKEYRKNLKLLKQMPQPAYTFRMKLVFPIPTTQID